MKKGFRKQFVWQAIVAGILLASSLWVVSCKDEYLYDNKEPEWLGASIYDYLKTNGNFKYYTRLIDDLQESDKYRDVLSKTGSKTLFVADDAAFDRFFQQNEWGVSSYEGLSMAQKRLILKFGMIDNAYVIDNLGNYYDGGSLQLGKALRRTTALSPLDTIPFESGDRLPGGTWWNSRKDDGLYLLQDATSKPTVYFLQSTLDNSGISDQDFSFITGEERATGDVHVFNNKVVERDITCKNGYVHVVENVMIPPANIAEHLREDPNTSIFSELLDRFSAPYYTAATAGLTSDYNQTHTEQIDSIFEIEYFSANDGAVTYPDGRAISEDLLLPFNPGMNGYQGEGTALQADMAAIIAPTDDAMNAYLNSGAGIVIKNRFGSWENVPDNIVIKFVGRHMKASFLQAVPSRFSTLTDSKNSPIPISTADITGSYIGVNGIVYNTSKVYPPDDYISVYAPVLLSANTKVFNWAINQNKFDYYLNSLVNRYSFFVPTDEFFTNYIDPIAYAKNVKAKLKYWYNEKTSRVNATVYDYETGLDSIGVITNSAFLAARLLDLLDSYTVVGDVEDGSSYYLTKNGNALKVEGSGSDLKVQGGWDIANDVTANTIGFYEQENGNTYFIDKPIQTPLRSVYGILKDTPQFQKFFELLSGFNDIASQVGGETVAEIFVRKTNYYGMDYSVKFLNTFNYTVYVPTNDAIDQAVQEGLIKNWDQINAITDDTEKAAEILKLERFVRYHFQDNSIFISGKAVNKVYQTATINMDTDPSETQFGTFVNKYYKLGITGDGDNLALSTENYGSANVVKDDGLYNIMARDYIFSGNPASYKEIDGTGSGSLFTAASITTSSTAVIHQIDKVLRFE